MNSNFRTKRHWRTFCLALVVVAVLPGCGKPRPSERYQRPDQITDFPVLFGKSCSGCHGMDGQLGPAPPLNDQLFQAIISEDQLTSIIQNGRPGTLMPAFAHSQGGTLTDEQIAILVQGIRQRWHKPTSEQPLHIPRYQVLPDDPEGIIKPDFAAGRKLFVEVCASCHGENGQGAHSGPLLDHALAELLSDQLLRRIIITGRPDLGMPNYVELGEKSTLGRPLTSSEIVNLTGYVRSLQNATVESHSLSTTE